MKATVRKAQADDAAAAWEIRNASVLSGCKGFYSDELLANWIDGRMTEKFVRAVDEFFYVACVDSVVVGTGIIDLGTGKLDSIHVRPDKMGRGIGKQIVLFLEEMARAAGLKTLTLDSTLNAAPFYRRCGFVGEAVGKFVSPRGIVLDCIPMTKVLSLPGYG
jgi:GNAT superfamily N-acetyltransferase